MKITSARQLSAAVGRSPAVVARWLQRPDWPFGPPPWPISLVLKIQAWMGGLQEDRSAEDREDNADVPAEPSLEKKVKLKLALTRIRRLELEIQKIQAAQGHMISKAEMEDGFVRRILAVKSEIYNTARLIGLIEPFLQSDKLREADAAIRNWADGVCDRFAGEADFDPPCFWAVVNKHADLAITELNELRGQRDR